MEKSNNTSFIYRTISSGVFLAILFLSFLNKYFFLAIFEFFMLQSLLEFYRISEKTGGRPKKWFGLSFSALLFLFFFLQKNNFLKSEYIFLIIALSFVSFSIELLRKGSTIKNLSAEFLGIFYVAVPFSITNFIVFVDSKFDYSILLGVFFIIWTYDVSAYLIGSLIGKTKIFPTISPNKSLEGTIVGIILGIAASVVVFKVLKIYNLTDWIIMSVLIVFGAFTGDLVESKLKRSANVKDSGKIMPGHGGLLDRFDSFLFAIVAVSIYLIFL